MDNLNPFGDMTSEGLEDSQDRLGGFQRLDTDIYTGRIKMFYAGKSPNGAKNVTVILQEGDFPNEYRETIYVSKTTGENWFPNKNDATKKVPLPGFTVIEEMCLATVGKLLKDLTFEEKTVNLWDNDLRKEMPTKVMMATELLGQEVSVAIVKTVENQTEKNQQTGEYVPKADGSTKEVNNIDKVFNTASKKTVPEARENLEPKFWDSWVERNKGVTRDKTAKGNTQSGRPGSGAPAAGNGGGQEPRKSLFG